MTAGVESKDDDERGASKASARASGARSRICISCRTLLDTGQECTGKNHHTVSLVTSQGRDRIDDEVWGPDSRARAMRQAARAGAGGATAGGLLQGCDALSGCDVLSGGGEAILGAIAVVLVMAAVAIVSILLWWIIKAIINAIRNAMDRPKPHGALLEPPKPTKMAVAGKGVVRSGTPLATPWKAGHAFAYAMELYGKSVFGGGAMLRDATTAGFEVTLDDGRVLKVPAGRVRILGKRERVETDTARVDGFVRAIDSERMEAERPLFPYDFVRAVTIDPGDRVEVLGDVEIAAGEDGSAGYRGSAGFVTPIGVPVLRVRKATPRVRVADDVAAAPTSTEQGDEEIEEEEDEQPKQQEMRR